MKLGTVALVVLALVVVALGGLALRAGVDGGNVELQAARAAQEQERAAQEAVKTWQAQREAELAVQVAAERAQNAVMFDGAWASLGLVVAFGLGGAAVVLAVGLAFAAVGPARLRARLVRPIGNMASGVYPALVSGGGLVVDMPQPRLASRRVEPQLEAPAAALPALAPAAELPQRVDVASWQPGGALALPVGVGLGGALSVALDATWSLGLVVGLPGSGKSSLLRALVVGLARQDATGRRALVAALDTKSTEFAACDGRAILWGGAVARSQSEIAQNVRGVAMELRNRFDAIRQADADNYLALGIPALVLVCDELAIVAQDGETLQELTNIARLGRAAGVYSILATQRPSAAVISGELRALADWAVCFAVERRAEALVCGIPGAEQLPRQPGRALFRRGDTMPVQASFPPSWRNDLRSLPMVAEGRYNRLQPVATTPQPALTPQPVAQPALYRRNVALTPQQAAAIRAAAGDGASMNELCRRFYGSKDGAALASIRAALDGGRG